MLKNPYTTSPDELKPGDVMAVTVTLHVAHHGPPYFKLYRCPLDGHVSEDGVPQGDKLMTNLQEVAEALFPAAIWAGMEPTY